MERIFNNSLGGDRFDTGDPANDYEALVRARIDDAVDFEESYLGPAREENIRYYYGYEPAIIVADEGEEAINKSTFVSTDVRDTILTILPSLIRIFTGTENVANFEPNTEEQQDMADQAYDYINYIFYNDNEGFLILHSIFKDALTLRAGIVKWWTDDDHEITEQEFAGLAPEQLQMLIYENPEAEVVDIQETAQGINVRIRHAVSKPVHKVVAVPPNEFRIAKDATSIRTASLVGHERAVSLSELASKGLDPEMLVDYMSATQDFTSEKQYRNPASINGFEVEKQITYGEFFIRIDKDGDGIDELRCIHTIGDDRIIVEDYIAPHANLAVFSGDPRPHTVIGDCMADLAKDIQRIKTNMMRGTLDNLAESNNPRMVINELVTNVEDALSDEVGGIIRTRGDPATAVSYTKTPYVGADVQMTIDYLDKVRASRTGITEASKGLDPKAMQSTALSGIDAIVSGAQERIELIARILAETGMKDVLKGLLYEVTNKPNKARTMRIRGKWVNIDPSLFDPTMRVQINPTLGKGSDLIRMQALASVKEDQLTIISKFGIANPVVTPEQYLNTIEDTLKLVNIKNPGRYFIRPSPEVMQSIMEAPTEPDPAQVLAQAELEKVKAGTIKAISEKDTRMKELDLSVWKAREEADFKRDKLNLDTAVDAIAALKGIQEQIGPQKGLLAFNQSDA